MDTDPHNKVGQYLKRYFLHLYLRHRIHKSQFKVYYCSFLLRHPVYDNHHCHADFFLRAPYENEGGFLDTGKHCFLLPDYRFRKRAPDYSGCLYPPLSGRFAVLQPYSDPGQASYINRNSGILHGSFDYLSSGRLFFSENIIAVKDSFLTCQNSY